VRKKTGGGGEKRAYYRGGKRTAKAGEPPYSFKTRVNTGHPERGWENKAGSENQAWEKEKDEFFSTGRAKEGTLGGSRKGKRTGFRGEKQQRSSTCMEEGLGQNGRPKKKGKVGISEQKGKQATS